MAAQDDLAESVNDSLFNVKYLPKTSTIQRNLYCCTKCHFVQPGRYASKENREDECPNCYSTDIIKLSYNSPILTILNPEKSFLGRVLMSKANLKTLIPGMYSLYVIYEQNDEKDE